MDLPGRAVVLEAAALGLLDAVGVPVPRRVGERRRGRVRDRLPPLVGPRLLEGPPQRALELLLLVLRPATPSTRATRAAAQSAAMYHGMVLAAMPTIDVTLRAPMVPGTDAMVDDGLAGVGRWTRCPIDSCTLAPISP